jgi:hypothetical protein
MIRKARTRFKTFLEVNKRIPDKTEELGRGRRKALKWRT